MYRELQRARHHERPLSLIVLEVDDSSMSVAIPAVAEEIRKSMEKKIMLARVARILDDNLPRFHTFALRNNCFIAAMPETTEEEAAEIIHSVALIAAKDLGVTISSGVAALSDNATTLETLVDLAESKLHEAQVRQSPTDPRQMRLTLESPSRQQAD
jgi:GGDEF domain-containing protein